ncbi:exonuclease SbcCD subunit D [Anaerovibrio sp. RM50]|uniref:exonuclease SbcCD subunit D n=1 Tax=Anaerovibrio sp. RM50 TaxID=1200557 RepID=UPI000489693C|nr:exonuclease SbcCD subunit D [Anaerovibrio sp. RM50]
MRFIHTADWHLGRTLYNRPLLDDQKAALDELLKVAEEKKIDALVIAGDIFDRSNPPGDAIELFDSVLARLKDLGIKVLFIAGNHDGAQRIDYGRQLMAASGVHTRGIVTQGMEPVVLEDEFGPVYFSLIPYVTPEIVREVFLEEERLDFNAANKIMVDDARKLIPEGVRSVAVAHAFITGGKSSDSERELSVGGASNVDCHIYEKYNYTALGHLHGPQRAGKENVRYSGSLLKYSIDEQHQDKGVLLIDMDGQGEISVEKIKLPVLHDVRVVEGLIEDLEQLEPSEDYVEVRLKNNHSVMSPADRLRGVFPNLLTVVQNDYAVDINNEYKVNFRGRTNGDLFQEFYKNVTGREMNEDELDLLDRVVRKVEGADE